jgi:hypothetical protein
LAFRSFNGETVCKPVASFRRATELWCQALLILLADATDQHSGRLTMRSSAKSPMYPTGTICGHFGRRAAAFAQLRRLEPLTFPKFAGVKLEIFL